MSDTFFLLFEMRFIFLIGFIFSFIISCSEEQKNIPGEHLSQIHCASCHAYPSPELLNKNSWDKHILPRMGYFMGVLPMDSVGMNFIEPEAKSIAFENPNVFRKESTLSEEEWKAIREFYLKNAPEKLPQNDLKEIKKESSVFETVFPPHYLSPPSTMMVEVSDNNGIFIGDFFSNKMYLFDEDLELKRQANIPSGIVDLVEIDEGTIVTSIGSFSPSDMPSGSVYFLPKNENAQTIPLISNLRRPVQTSVADLDKDGRNDLITSEFGKWMGGLNWWKNDGKGNFKKNQLRNMPGAMGTEVVDLNKDGLMDVVGLFGQGDEGVFVFWNKGNDDFEEEVLLRFPPSYGSSFFELKDYNSDGFLDVIYTCGDNADFPPINKPYHGIYIYKNNGENNFEESLFLPLNGAYSAKVEDFDLDGKLDIAAISFFPDFENKPEASFVLFKGEKEIPESIVDFSVETINQYNSGRWIVMDVGDIDGDGDTDLVLGSLAFETIPDNGEVDKWKKNGVPFIILKNKTK